MVDEITVPTYEQIEVMLTKLATNYSNLAIVFYDIFYNTTPMDVTFQMFDESGVIQTYTIPNRAKDMKNILNSESSEVTGSPEGQVEAARGTIFQDLDNGDLYIKETPSGAIGWSKFLRYSDLQEIIMEGIIPPEGSIVAKRGTLYVDKANAGLWMKLTSSGSEGWALISADTEKFATKEELGNLSAIVNLKESTANKINSITDQSTSSQYPSAPAVRSYVTNRTKNFANKDFSNISDVAKNYFANKDLSNISSVAKASLLGINRVPEGILEAPENMFIIIGHNNFKISAGTKFLCLNGLNADGTFNNEIEDVSVELYGSTGSASAESGYIFYSKLNNMVIAPTDNKYIVFTPEVEGEQPPKEELAVWFDPKNYKYYFCLDGIEWDQTPMVEIGRWTTDEEGDLDKVEIREVLKIATGDDVAHVVIETGGTDENWYRLYKDGWMEAGGCGYGNTEISFYKNFKSTKYTFVASGVASYTKAIDKVTIASSGDFDWIAKGWVV